MAAAGCVRVGGASRPQISSAVYNFRATPHFIFFPSQGTSCSPASCIEARPCCLFLLRCRPVCLCCIAGMPCDCRDAPAPARAAGMPQCLPMQACTCCNERHGPPCLPSACLVALVQAEHTRLQQHETALQEELASLRRRLQSSQVLFAARSGVHCGFERCKLWTVSMDGVGRWEVAGSRWWAAVGGCFRPISRVSAPPAAHASVRISRGG